jgi:hypothetical protein
MDHYQQAHQLQQQQQSSGLLKKPFFFQRKPKGMTNKNPFFLVTSVDQKIQFQHYAANPQFEKIAPLEQRWRQEYPQDAIQSQLLVHQHEKEQIAQTQLLEHNKRAALWGVDMQLK